MHADYKMSIAGLIVGIVVGLTGMGGGALMTPVLVIFFHTDPSAAVSSDLVTSLFMKPIGGAIHWRRATVHKGIVTWLLIAAVPAAFAGVFVLNSLGNGQTFQDRIKLALGSALLLAFVAMVTRMIRRSGDVPGDGLDSPVQKVRTLVIGAIGGLVVGMTSWNFALTMKARNLWASSGCGACVGTPATSTCKYWPSGNSAAAYWVFFSSMM